MRCERCGAEVNENEIICPNCGNTLNNVPNYSDLESVLADGVADVINEKYGRTNSESDSLNKKVTDQNARINKEAAQRMKAAKLAEEERKKKIERIRREREKQKKKKITIAIIAAVVVVAIVVGILLFTHGSYSYQMMKGNSALKSKDYDQAITYFEKAASINEKKSAPYSGEGKAYIGKEDYDTCIDVCYKGIDIEPDYGDTYNTLCIAYEKEGNLEKITEVFKGVTDESVFKACKGYYVAAPEFSLEEGTYDEEKSLKLTCDTDDDIYYTVDGSTPTSGATLYDEKIKLEEQGDIVVRAIAINDKGIKSLVSEAKYTMDLPLIDSPEVSPSTGSYEDGDLTIEVSVPGGCEVYYTFDGTTPDENSSKYTSSINVTSNYIDSKGLDADNITFNCIAINKDSKRTSSVTKRNYSLNVSDY